jgi:protease-4
VSLETELYEERRRKWRRSAFWKGVFVTLAIIIGAVVGLVMLADDRPAGPHIARFYVDGIIYDDPARDALLAEIDDNPDVKALIIRINSPGGTTAGSEALHDAIRDIAQDVPVVAVMGEVAASGGYITAIAADQIFALGNTTTGSIGVIMEYPDVTGLMETLGVEMQTIRSSDIKGGPSPFRELTEEARVAQEAMVAEAFEWFKSLVAERRDLNANQINAVANGGVFSGRQAVENGLIDALGGEDEALEFLESLDASLATIPVETWELPAEDTGLLGFFGVNLRTNPLFDALSSDSGPRLYSLKR